MGRLAILGVLIAVTALATVLYKRRAAADAALGSVRSTQGVTSHDAREWPQLAAAELEPGAACTWIIFTTPFCASCGTVEAEIARAFPHHAVRLVDATERPELAGDYLVRRAPTTLLADHDGHVLERLVGPEGVRAFIGAADDPLLVDGAVEDVV